MAGRQAKILSSDHLNDLLLFAASTRNSLRNRLIVLLSAKAGLRTGVVANLTWDMVTDGNGQVGNVIELHDAAAKKGTGRSIPIHPDLAVALMAWRRVAGPAEFVISSQRGGPMTPLSIVVWLNQAFKNVGRQDCSSHSGRRTFVTRAAGLVHRAAAH
jgi:integrase